MWAGGLFVGGGVSFVVVCGLDALSAGMCARRRTYFSCSHKKSRQKKCAPLTASLRFAAGNLRCSRAGCAAELTARLRRSVQTTAASQITMRMLAALHPLTPPAALLGASRGEWETTRAIAALGPRSISAAASRGGAGLPLPLAGEGRGEGDLLPPPLGEGWGGGEPPVHWQRRWPPSLPSPSGGRRNSPLTPTLPQREREQDHAERSDGPNGLQRPSGRAEKRRAWGGPGSAACRASCSDSLRLFERRERSEQSEFRSAAPCPSIAGCPEAKRRGHGQWGRLSLVTFFGETKKVTAPPGAHPGQQRHQPPRR